MALKVGKPSVPFLKARDHSLTLSWSLRLSDSHRQMIAPCSTQALSNNFLLRCSALAPRLIQRLSILVQSHAENRTSSREAREVHVIIPDILLLQFLYSHQVVSRCRLLLYACSIKYSECRKVSTIPRPHCWPSGQQSCRDMRRIFMYMAFDIDTALFKGRHRDAN